MNQEIGRRNKLSKIIFLPTWQCILLDWFHKSVPVRSLTEQNYFLYEISLDFVVVGKYISFHFNIFNGCKDFSFLQVHPLPLFYKVVLQGSYFLSYKKFHDFPWLFLSFPWLIIHNPVKYIQWHFCPSWYTIKIDS